jgi:endonuclease/exonuclease/phosphatase family metal-dependent hydrolase
VKLIQANVWWGGKLTDALKKFLVAEDPDILCLQEAANIPGTTGMFLTVQQMQGIGRLDNMAFAPAVTLNFMHRKVDMGNAILSKLPIEQSESVYIHLEHNQDFDWDKHDYNVRNFLHGVIVLHNKPTHIITHHGYHIPEHKNGNAETLRQMKELAEYIKKLEGPIILTGDFNLLPHSKSLEIINKELTNLCIVNKVKTTRSNVKTRQEVCDYIFVNDQIKVKKFEASDKVVSDHKALILDFDV